MTDINLKDRIKWYDDVWYLNIKVIPQSPQNEIVSIMDDNTIKIRIKAIPEKWKANKELIKYLWKILNINKKNIEIISWISDQHKLIRIRIRNNY